MTWLYWLVLGLTLIAIELATPGGFFVIFFAVSAMLLSLLEVAGLLERDVLQWGLFPVLSLALLSILRRPLLEWMQRRGPTEQVDPLVGEVAFASGGIDPGQYGRAELRGSTWSVRNTDAVPLTAGQRCRVVAVRGLELDIRSE